MSEQRTKNTDNKTRLYSLVVEHTDAPADSRDVMVQAIVSMTRAKAKALKARAEALFEEHGDGNDNWYKMTLKPLKSGDHWNADDFSDYLDGFQLEEGLEGQQDTSQPANELAQKLGAEGITARVNDRGQPELFRPNGDPVPAGVLLSWGVRKITTTFRGPKLPKVEGHDDDFRGAIYAPETG
jgi:hypothetical protein